MSIDHCSLMFAWLGELCWPPTLCIGLGLPCPLFGYCDVLSQRCCRCPTESDATCLLTLCMSLAFGKFGDCHLAQLALSLTSLYSWGSSQSHVVLARPVQGPTPFVLFSCVTLRSALLSVSSLQLGSCTWGWGFWADSWLRLFLT